MVDPVQRIPKSNPTDASGPSPFASIGAVPTNGRRIVTLGRMGRVPFRLAEDTPLVELDVALVWNSWLTISNAFFEGKNELPTERLLEYNKAMYEFAQEHLQLNDKSKMSLSDAIHFIKAIEQEWRAARAFFEPKSEEKPSSPPPSDVTFST